MLLATGLLQSCFIDSRLVILCKKKKIFKSIQSFISEIGDVNIADELCEVRLCMT